MHHGLKILAACVYNLIGLHILLFTTAALTYCTTKGYTSSSTSHFPATTRGLSPFSPSFSSSSPVMGYTVYTIQHRNPIILDVEWEPSLLISSIGINNKRQKKLSIPHTHTRTRQHTCVGQSDWVSICDGWVDCDTIRHPRRWAPTQKVGKRRKEKSPPCARPLYLVHLVNREMNRK